MHVALLGASGAVGRSISGALASDGTPFRVVGRDPSTLTREFPGSDIAAWDLDQPETIRAAVRGADTLIYLIGVPYDHFELHPLLMRRVLDAAIAERVPRMLLIGTVYPYGRPRRNPVDEDHPREPHTFKGRMRKEQEDLLLEASASGRIQGAVLRLPDFYGPGVRNSFLWSLFEAAANGGRANLIGPLDKPHEFVFIPDVGPVVSALIRQPGAWNHVWHLAGAGAITQREIVATVFRLAGRPPKTMVAGKTLLRLMGLFNPFMRELADMHYLVTDPVFLDDSRLQSLLGSVHKTPYEEGLRRSLESARLK